MLRRPEDMSMTMNGSLNIPGTPSFVDRSQVNERWGQVFTIGEDGQRGQTCLHLTRDEYTFGRSRSCDVRINMPRVSRNHLRLYRINEAAFAEQISPNAIITLGTHSSIRITNRCALEDGQIINIHNGEDGPIVRFQMYFFFENSDSTIPDTTAETSHSILMGSGTPRRSGSRHRFGSGKRRLGPRNDDPMLIPQDTREGYFGVDLLMSPLCRSNFSGPPSVVGSCNHEASILKANTPCSVRTTLKRNKSVRFSAFATEASFAATSGAVTPARKVLPPHIMMKAAQQSEKNPIHDSSSLTRSHSAPNLHMLVGQGTSPGISPTGGIGGTQGCKTKSTILAGCTPFNHRGNFQRKFTTPKLGLGLNASSKEKGKKIAKHGEKLPPLIQAIVAIMKAPATRADKKLLEGISSLHKSLTAVLKEGAKHDSGEEDLSVEVMGHCADALVTMIQFDFDLKVLEKLRNFLSGIRIERNKNGDEIDFITALKEVARSNTSPGTIRANVANPGHLHNGLLRCLALAVFGDASQKSKEELKTAEEQCQRMFEDLSSSTRISVDQIPSATAWRLKQGIRRLLNSEKPQVWRTIEQLCERLGCKPEDLPTMAHKSVQLGLQSLLCKPKRIASLTPERRNLAISSVSHLLATDISDLAGLLSCSAKEFNSWGGHSKTSQNTVLLGISEVMVVPKAEGIKQMSFDGPDAEEVPWDTYVSQCCSLALQSRKRIFTGAAQGVLDVWSMTAEQGEDYIVLKAKNASDDDLMRKIYKGMSIVALFLDGDFKCMGLSLGLEGRDLEFMQHDEEGVANFTIESNMTRDVQVLCIGKVISDPEPESDDKKVAEITKSLARKALGEFEIFANHTMTMKLPGGGTPKKMIPQSQFENESCSMIEWWEQLCGAAFAKVCLNSLSAIVSPCKPKPKTRKRGRAATTDDIPTTTKRAKKGSKGRGTSKKKKATRATKKADKAKKAQELKAKLVGFKERPVSEYTEEWLKDCKVAELRGLCSKNSLTTTGRKPQLIQRLFSFAKKNSSAKKSNKRTRSTARKSKAKKR